MTYQYDFLHLKPFNIKNIYIYIRCPFSQSNVIFFLCFSCHSNYCAWSSRHRFVGKLNSVFSEQTDGALLQRDRLVKVFEGPVSMKRTWPLSCISMFAGAYKGAEKGFHYVTIFKHNFCVQALMRWIQMLYVCLQLILHIVTVLAWAKSALIQLLSEVKAGHWV